MATTSHYLHLSF